MTDWQNWIGRTETHHDRVDPGLIARWCATFDRAIPADGTAPQGVHWCLGLTNAATAQLGPDGHPQRADRPDSAMPPIPLPRRMWAGSTVRFIAPLRADTPVRRTAQVTAITAKQGNSGALVFVEIAYATHHDAQLLIEETQTIVYRAAAPQPPTAEPAPPATRPFDPADWPMVRTVMPTAPLLFRYSALTFNSHRIHYDAPYATGAEGYRGLVVHGPLVASLLLDLARRRLGDNRLRTFRFRAQLPAIADEPLHLVLRDAPGAVVLRAYADDGRLISDGHAG